MSDYWHNEYGHREEVLLVIPIKGGSKVKCERRAITGPYPTQLNVLGMFKGLEDYPYARMSIDGDTLSVTWWAERLDDNE